MLSIDILPSHHHGGGFDSSHSNNPAAIDLEDGGGGAVVADVGLYDILCGRHKAAFNNIGNRRFRVTVGLALPRYMAAPSRKDKSVVIKSVKALVESNGGRFIQRKKGAWVELTQKQAHEKVGHALRDMAMAKSSECASVLASSKSSASNHHTSNNNSGGGAFARSSTRAAAAVTAAAAPTAQSLEEPQQDKNEAVTAVLDSFVNSTVPKAEQAQLLQLQQHQQQPPLQQQYQQQQPQQQQPQALPQDDYLQWEPRVAHGTERKSVDDNMLSWLVGESQLLLDSDSEDGGSGSMFTNFEAL